MSSTLMASAISTSTNLCLSSPFPNTKFTTCHLSTPSTLSLKTSSSGFTTLLTPLGLCPFSAWNGLRHMGISISQKSLKIERKGRLFLLLCLGLELLKLWSLVWWPCWFLVPRVLLRWWTITKQSIFQRRVFKDHRRAAKSIFFPTGGTDTTTG